LEDGGGFGIERIERFVFSVSALDPPKTHILASPAASEPAPRPAVARRLPQAAGAGRRTVRAEESEHLPTGDGEGDIGDSTAFPETARQPIGDNHRIRPYRE
jgi:hypothetical protein